MIPVSFSFLYYVMLFIFFIINQFAKIIIIILFFHKNYFDFFMFWDVPECSMFRVLLMVR